VSPGVRKARPGSIKVMNNDNATERAVALVNQMLDALDRANWAPESPVNALLTPKLRREFRRGAARLRQGKSQPKYKNLYTAEQLADIYERTVQRDEIVEPAIEDCRRIGRELRRIVEESPEVLPTIAEMIVDAKRLADESGPDSEAAQRYLYMKALACLSQQSRIRGRRQKARDSRPMGMAPDPSVEEYNQMSAMEILDSPPAAGETVIAIPPEGMDSGRGRILIRIGVDERSWTGSFERGRQRVSTACMMPDGKHLFVSAEGAGYIIDARSRTLVETIGTDVAGVMLDEKPPTLLIVDHNGVRLEAFGKSGRLWKTTVISVGGFRRLGFTGYAILGEARHPKRPGWARFFVMLATGKGVMGGRG